MEIFDSMRKANIDTKISINKIKRMIRDKEVTYVI